MLNKFRQARRSVAIIQCNYKVVFTCKYIMHNYDKAPTYRWIIQFVR